MKWVDKCSCNSPSWTSLKLVWNEKFHKKCFLIYLSGNYPFTTPLLVTHAAVFRSREPSMQLMSRSDPALGHQAMWPLGCSAFCSVFWKSSKKWIVLIHRASMKRNMKGNALCIVLECIKRVQFPLRCLWNSCPLYVMACLSFLCFYRHACTSLGIAIVVWTAEI